MSGPSFVGSGEKIDRAEAYYDGLKEEMDRFTDAQQEAIFSEFEGDTSPPTRCWIIEDPGNPDPEWGLRIGEILYHLWSALDHVVYQLVKASGAHHSGEHQFIVRKNRADFYCDSKTYLRGIRSEWVDAIERTQPYNREYGSLDRLYRLHNIDKHDKIHLVMSDVEAITTRGDVRGWEIPGGALKGRTVVARLPVSGPEDDVDPHISLGIFFAESPVQRYPVDFVLESFIGEVRAALKIIEDATGTPP